MFDASVYYCWSCDAHRRATPATDGKVRCPRCQRELPADSRLPIRGASGDAGPKVAWPAPVRPRLATTA
jgi:hypothetical protein